MNNRLNSYSYEDETAVSFNSRIFIKNSAAPKTMSCLIQIRKGDHDKYKRFENKFRGQTVTCESLRI